MKLGDMKSLCLEVHVLKVCVMNFFYLEDCNMKIESWKFVS